MEITPKRQLFRVLSWSALTRVWIVSLLQSLGKTLHSTPHLVAGGEKSLTSKGLSSSLPSDPGLLISLAVPALYVLIHDLLSFLKSLF